VWGSEFTSKDAAVQGGLVVALRTLFAAALVVRRRYMAVVPGPMPAAVASRCFDAGFNSWLAPGLTRGSMLEVSRDAVAAGEEQLVAELILLYLYSNL
jgi:hypothetical protein